MTLGGSKIIGKLTSAPNYPYQDKKGTKSHEFGGILVLQTAILRMPNLYTHSVYRIVGGQRLYWELRVLRCGQGYKLFLARF